MAFRKKFDNIRAFDPDVMIIQECEAPDVIRKHLGDSYQILWIGDNARKGLGVFVRQSIGAELLQVDSGHIRHMLPVRLNNGITLIAFWAMNDQLDMSQRYIGQVWQGLRCCEDHLAHPCIVTGDFNWNQKFDTSMSRKPQYGTMSGVTELLHSHNVSSIYHSISQASFGNESDPTFLMYRHQDKAYHTDYLFLSQQLTDSVVSFELGSFAEWGTISDHMPFFIEFPWPDGI